VSVLASILPILFTSTEWRVVSNVLCWVSFPAVYCQLFHSLTICLSWVHCNQDTIQTDLYSNLKDQLCYDNVDLAETGHCSVLLSSFVDSDQFIQQLFQDSMALVYHFGKPALFITFTANPHWPEIVDALLPGQQPTDQPDLIA
jgi:hypothetical protein